jgi:hypothetical protein
VENIQDFAALVTDLYLAERDGAAIANFLNGHISAAMGCFDPCGFKVVKFCPCVIGDQVFAFSNMEEIARRAPFGA